MAVDLGDGTTLTAGTSAWAPVKVSIDAPAITRPVIDTTHLGTTGTRTKIVGKLMDSDPMSVEIQFDPALDPPVDAVAETWTIDFAGSADTWAFSGVLTSLKPGVRVGELMTATAEITPLGAITITN